MKCYLCGSEKHHKRQGKVRDDASINILECDECGLVFLDKQKTGDEYYEQGNMHGQAELYKLTQKLDLANDGHSFNLARYEFVKDRIIGKDILDFGSGYAGFLRFCKALAKSVTGVELESGVEPIYQKHGITLKKNLSELLGGGGLQI